MGPSCDPIRCSAGMLSGLWSLFFLLLPPKTVGKYFPSCILQSAHLILSSLASSFLDIFDENMIWLVCLYFYFFSSVLLPLRSSSETRLAWPQGRYLCTLLWPSLCFIRVFFNCLEGTWHRACSEGSATPSCCWLMGKEPVSLIIPCNSRVSLLIPWTLFKFLDDQTSQDRWQEELVCKRQPQASCVCSQWRVHQTGGAGGVSPFSDRWLSELWGSLLLLSHTSQAEMTWYISTLQAAGPVALLWFLKQGSIVFHFAAKTLQGESSRVQVILCAHFQ